MADYTKPAKNSEAMYDDAPLTTVRDYAIVAPNDATELDPWPRALRAGSAGAIAVTTIRGDDVTFLAVQEGETIPCWCRKVLATGTTVTSIVAYYG